MQVVRCAQVCLAAGVWLAAATAGAQSLGEAARKAREQHDASGSQSVKLDDRDVNSRLAAQEVLDFEVDAERWRRFVAADVWVNRALEKDPALMERLTVLKADTARALERFIAREPALVKALSAAASDPHEYAFTQVALTVAIMLNLDQNVVAAKAQLPAATQANMALVKAHEAELKAMLANALQLKERAAK